MYINNASEGVKEFKNRAHRKLQRNLDTASYY